MSLLTDALTAIKTVLEGVSGIETVYDHVPETFPPDSQLPAVLMHVLPATVTSSRLANRSYMWPLDLVVINSKRGSNVGVTVTDAYDLPELVIAALDSAGSFNGVLDQMVRYADPAVSADSGGAFGIIQGDRQQYAGTTIHTEITLVRVGGFT